MLQRAQEVASGHQQSADATTQELLRAIPIIAEQRDLLWEGLVARSEDAFAKVARAAGQTYESGLKLHMDRVSKR